MHLKQQICSCYDSIWHLHFKLPLSSTTCHNVEKIFLYFSFTILKTLLKQDLLWGVLTMWILFTKTLEWMFFNVTNICWQKNNQKYSKCQGMPLILLKCTFFKCYKCALLWAVPQWQAICCELFFKMQTKQAGRNLFPSKLTFLFHKPAVDWQPDKLK